MNNVSYLTVQLYRIQIPDQKKSTVGFANVLVILCGEHTNFQVFIVASFPASFMFQGLLVAPTAFRKPYLNMLREATVAQAPRAHFDPCRSEGLFFFSSRG